MRGYDDDRKTKVYISIALIGGIISGFALNGLVSGAVFSGSSSLYIIGIPNSVGVGKITNVTFITFGEGAAVSNANITLDGAASGRGTTDPDGMLVLSVNATSKGTINVTAEKAGYKNATSTLFASPGLVISASPGSITSGTASYVTLSVGSVGKPVGGAAVNLSGAGVSIDGVTNSNGQIIVQINAPGTGTITVTTRQNGYSDGETAITSTSQQMLSVSSSHSTVTVNVPTYISFTVTAGGSAVNDATISLSGAASGNGVTNQDGTVIILVAPGSAGTITASASRTGYAGGSIAITSSGTQSLSITGSPATVTAGVQAYVMFTVTSGNNVVSEAAVTLTGAASGSGITNQNGQVILAVNSTSAGTITASASKNGYSSASTSINAAGQQTLGVSASPSNIANGIATYVTFTVTGGGSAVSGVTVSVSGGGISTDGVTNSAGQVTLQLTASGTGTISVTARKTGYVDGLTTLAH